MRLALLVTAIASLFAGAANAHVVKEKPNCREYTSSIVIDGKEQPSYGTACKDANGEWKIQSQELGEREHHKEKVVHVPVPTYKKPYYKKRHHYGYYKPSFHYKKYGYNYGYKKRSHYRGHSGFKGGFRYGKY